MWAASAVSSIRGVCTARVTSPLAAASAILSPWGSVSTGLAFHTYTTPNCCIDAPTRPMGTVLLGLETWRPRRYAKSIPHAPVLE